MAAAAILKNRRIDISSDGLSDFNKIWHSDVVCPSLPFKILKIQDGSSRHLEKSKIEISQQRFDES